MMSSLSFPGPTGTAPRGPTLCAARTPCPWRPTGADTPQPDLLLLQGGSQTNHFCTAHAKQGSEDPEGVNAGGGPSFLVPWGLTSRGCANAHRVPGAQARQGV